LGHRAPGPGDVQTLRLEGLYGHRGSLPSHHTLGSCFGALCAYGVFPLTRAPIGRGVHPRAGEAFVSVRHTAPTDNPGGSLPSVPRGPHAHHVWVRAPCVFTLGRTPVPRRCRRRFSYCAQYEKRASRVPTPAACTPKNTRVGLWNAPETQRLSGIPLRLHPPPPKGPWRWGCLATVVGSCDASHTEVYRAAHAPRCARLPQAARVLHSPPAPRGDFCVTSRRDGCLMLVRAQAVCAGQTRGVDHSPVRKDRPVWAAHWGRAILPEGSPLRGQSPHRWDFTRSRTERERSVRLLLLGA
jgi:hypothetical protein